MRLSIIIPAYNEEELLEETLERINAARTALDSDSELIVVDNESTDRTREIAEAAGAQIVTETVKNIGAIRNAGARAATGDTVVFFDADTLVPENMLIVIEQATQDPKCFGGAAAVSYGTFERSWLNFLSRAWKFWGGVFNMKQGAAQFCRRSVFEKISGYDDMIYLGEDIDFYWRLTRFARENGGTLSFIEEPTVTTSTRRFDKMSFWETMVLTHPIYILINWRRSKPWKRWYDGSVR
jgi:glycosyltransferase involved in cell wall biosynthesis